MPPSYDTGEKYVWGCHDWLYNVICMKSDENSLPRLNTCGSSPYRRHILGFLFLYFRPITLIQLSYSHVFVCHVGAHHHQCKNIVRAYWLSMHTTWSSSFRDLVSSHIAISRSNIFVFVCFCFVTRALFLKFTRVL